MQNCKRVTLAPGVEIEVRELTGLDIDEWLAEDSKGTTPLTGVELMLLPPVMPVHIPIQIVMTCTSLGKAEISTLTISQATKLWSAVLEVNDFLRHLLAAPQSALRDRSGEPLSAP